METYNVFEKFNQISLFTNFVILIKESKKEAMFN